MDQSQIWDHYQNEGSNTFRGARPRLAYLAGLVRSGSDVLNVGVGDGTFERIAVAGGLRVHVLDPNATAVERVREELSLGDCAKSGVAQAIPWPEGSFDVVVLSEVLEHLDNDTLTRALAEVHRVLRSGGQLIGTVPADERLADQQAVCPGCGCRFHRWGHEQSFSPERLRALLKESVGETDVRRRWFIAWSQLNWKGKLHAGARQVLAALGIWGPGHNLLFVARRK